MSLIDIRDRALEIAHTQIGVREEGGCNRGPQVERYLHAVGLPAGQPWCAAFVVWCYQEAARAFLQHLPLKRTGKCARLWFRSPLIWHSRFPTVGSIYVHLADPTDHESPGHCGIVTEFSDRSFAAIEGNTNATGSANGDRVRENIRPRGYALGFLDVGREGPQEHPRLT